MVNKQIPNAVEAESGVQARIAGRLTHTACEIIRIGVGGSEAGRCAGLGVGGKIEIRQARSAL